MQNELSYEIRLIENSSLNINTKNIAVDILKNNIDNMYGNNSVGDFSQSIKNLKILESDLISTNINKNILEMLIFNVMRKHCNKNEELESTLIKTFFDDKNFREQLKFIENPQTRIISFLKGLVPLIDNFYNQININDIYSALKKHHEILDYCLYDGIDKSLLNNDQKLKETLEKQFNETNLLRLPFYFKKQINDKIIKEDKENNFKYIQTGTSESFYVQKILHEKMINLHQKNGCMTYIYDRNINIYKINDFIIVTYRYDNVPNMVLKKNNLELNWNDRDFWAKIFDKDINFVTDKSVNYFIENEELEFYKVVPKTFNKYFNKLGNNIMFTPERYMDDAIYLYFTENNALNSDSVTKKYLEKIGIPLIPNKNLNLMTSDNSFFFIDPTKIDDLEVEDINDYKYLALLKCKDEKSRNKSIAHIKAAAKKNPKKPELKKEKYNPYIKKYQNKQIRLPYKDN